jgi:hypothetical protein
MDNTPHYPARSARLGYRHAVPGERERIAFHVHQFDHGCYGRHCPESDQLYAAWQAALTPNR